MQKNVLEFPDRPAIEEQAAVWLMKLDADESPSAEELAALREWLARSPVHRAELGSLATLWGKMNVLTELAVPLEKHEKGKYEWGAKFGFFTGLRRASVTGGVVMASLLLAFTLWVLPDAYLGSNGLYATAIGQQQTVTLADGSILVLNTNSQIRVEYGERFRDIHQLQGEVHFTVTKNTRRPFRVYAGNGRVQAVGTAFSVYIKDNAVDVTVTEGRVNLASVNTGKPSDMLLQEGSSLPVVVQPDIEPERQVDGQLSGAGATADAYVEVLGTIKAGESATLHSVGSEVNAISTLDSIETLEAPEMARRLSWRSGLLMFHGDPLEAVVAEISRYTSVSIEFSDPALKAIKIGGQFPVGETEAMFDALEVNFGLRVIRLSHDRVLLSHKE